MKKLALYFHTLKYLKFTQLYHRVLKRFTHPKINLIKAERADISGQWQVHELCAQKFINETDVNFLNHPGFINVEVDWNNEKEEKLWLYNLHYFDDLNSFGSKSRQPLQSHWVNKWIDENSAIKGGNGWESYTLSLRIVNWTKAFLSGLEADDKMLNSLAQQADFLSQDLEKHLLGNHYFVNLKALFFAGCYFKGKEADKWLAIALDDYESELKEQVLSDGGSFELTPMYHSIMLTDLLDLVNLFNVFPSRVSHSLVELTKQTIIKMFGWLHIMSLGDDKVSFFNDSTFGIAPDNSVLRGYAEKLGLTAEKLALQENNLAVYDIQHSGYVSVKSTNMCLIADLARVGPSYIPGHAHADSLSFEMSLGETRVFVNSGISLYGMSEERLRQRGTAAHNTLVINGLNSSEVWNGFRVARRADIDNRIVGSVSEDQTVNFSASHNGYKKLGVNCIHNRSWNVSLTELTITDILKGKFDSAFAYLHLHPEVSVISTNKETCVLRTDEYEIQLKIAGVNIAIEDSSWHPEFGIVLQSKKIRLQYLTQNVSYHINWYKL